ncbi:Rho-related protein racI [Clonorchis sinensis]|uniref:Rho-related protein racI n=1 Tax=Clonorchis sinensis TaxID=79923 RepID=G7Y6A9_CLOSI|nr:Rho-related protein racI [Clonorchis sinensis]
MVVAFIEFIFTSPPLEQRPPCPGAITLDEARRLRMALYPNCDAVVLCASLDNLASLENLSKKWLEELRTARMTRHPLLLALTKSDLRVDSSADLIKPDANRRKAVNEYCFKELQATCFSSGYTDIRAELNSHTLASRLEQFIMPAEMEPLDVNSTARDVEDYLERFDIWCLTKSDMDDKKLTAYFLHFVGKEAYTLIKNLVYPESPIHISYNELKKKLLQHFKPINFVAAERARFNMLTRSHSQSVRDFVLQLQTQAAKCDYGAQLEDQLRDRLIAGIQLPELQQKLLLCPDQKFQTIRKICEQYEDVKHNSSHVFKTLISASGQKHDFIVDTGSVEPIIPQSDLTVFYPSAVIVPTDVNIRGITGNSVPLVGSCTIPVRLPQGTSIDCNFLVSTSGPSIIGLKVLRSLRTSITLLTSVNVNELKQLILKCSKATGGMQIPKVRLEVTGDPIFLKRRIIPFGLREPVRQALNSMCAKGILTPVESSNWATPIVTPLKADGITPRICGD